MFSTSNLYSHAHKCSTKCPTEKIMQSFLRLIAHTPNRIATARNASSLLSTLPPSDPQNTQFNSDPKPELGDNLLTLRLQKLPPGESVVPALQGWIHDGFAVDRDAISQAVNSLRRRRLYSSALQVMEWVMKERPYQVTELDYFYLLDCTSKCHSISHTDKLLVMVPKCYQSGVLTRLVMSRSGEYRIDHTYAFMHRMRMMSLPISPHVYHKLITMHLAPTRRKVIPDILKHMKEDGVKPLTSTLNVLLNLHADHHDVEAMSEVFDEMLKLDVEPDEITYCILAKAYALARLYTVAETYVEDIERLETDNNSLDILIMLYGCLNKDIKLDSTWKLVRTLPNVATRTYLLAIEAFGKLRSVSSAEEIWAEFRSCKEITLTNEFNSMLSVYCRYGFIEKAVEIRKEMAASNCKPNAITYRHLALCYLKVGRVSDAEEMVRMGKWEPLTSNVMRSISWLESTLMVVEMFGSFNNLEYAEIVFKELRKSKYSRHAFVYNALLKGYVQARLYLPDLLERMISDGAEPDAESHNLLKLIEQFKKSY